VKKDEIASRVDAAARILGLGEFLKRKPNQLSGGQRQRVAMGRAIVREPAVFLFDEPLSNLDAKLRVQMRLEIKKLQRDLGTTSVYVTHDQVEAMTLADRLVVLNAGIAEQIGTPLEVYDKPASVFVAGFIGSPAMNFLPARLTPAGDAVTIGEGGELPLARPVAGGREVTLGLRPEHLRIDDAAAHLDLRVDLVEPLGADTLVHGHFARGGSDLTIRLSGNPKVGAGEVLPLAVAPENLHVFDLADGRRIVA
jgi:sn-glycerol 3-phosphate transport system ATP-binding protein